MRRIMSAGAGMATAIVLLGCATTGPIAPLVPLPDDRMPSREDLAYKPWRVIVAEPGGRYRATAQAFCSVLQTRLNKYGIQTVSSDAQSNRLIADMLRMQLEGGGEVDIRDPKYEMLSADGVITVLLTAVNVRKNNERTSWKDDEGKIHHRFDSVVQIEGSYTLAIPKTGVAQTMPFRNSDTKTSYGKPHQFSVNAMALNAARGAARNSAVLKPIYTRFPLAGYVIGTGDHPRYVKINRGANHGVRRDRKWQLIMEEVEHNPLVGDMITATVIGTVHTVEVQPEYCIAKTDSSRTRQKVKLGMKVRSIGFGFSWSGLFSD